MLPMKIEDRCKRINIKSKRRKNLFKKAIEIRYKCGLEMLVIMKDAEFGKYTVYNSCTESFDMKDVNRLITKDNPNECDGGDEVKSSM